MQVWLVGEQALPMRGRGIGHPAPGSQAHCKPANVAEQLQKAVG
jgi:hypothetical protein